MELRTCPSCRDKVGAQSVVCPRCGVNFRAARVRKIVWRTLSVLLILWLIRHFFFNKF